MLVEFSGNKTLDQHLGANSKNTIFLLFSHFLGKKCKKHISTNEQQYQYFPMWDLLLVGLGKSLTG